MHLEKVLCGQLGNWRKRKLCLQRQLSLPDTTFWAALTHGLSALLCRLSLQPDVPRQHPGFLSYPPHMRQLRPRVGLRPEPPLSVKALRLRICTDWIPGASQSPGKRHRLWASCWICSGFSRLRQSSIRKGIVKWSRSVVSDSLWPHGW